MKRLVQASLNENLSACPIAAIQAISIFCFHCRNGQWKWSADLCIHTFMHIYILMIMHNSMEKSVVQVWGSLRLFPTSMHASDCAQVQTACGQLGSPCVRQQWRDGCGNGVSMSDVFIIHEWCIP